MSYNPAFVADELPTASGDSSGACGQTNGIKLTSFKPLPTGGADSAVQQRLSGGGGPLNERPNGHHRDHHNQNHPHQQQQQHHRHHKSKKNASANADLQTEQTANTKLPSAQSKQQQQQQHKKRSSNLLLSTSSSLSLIENPTLNSLTPSASSYSTTNTNTNATTNTINGTSSNSSSIVSTTTTGLCAAVECRDMRYDVGRGKSAKTILHDINVTVPEGSIYGLLGPSGCGKTTMLRCVVGRIKPKMGTVRVFGYRPNDAGSQIPGPAIGYMPQEISVYEDFTINETLTYFGKINKMKQDLIDARIEFLLNFLDLPGKNRLIASLSGGQKRRVSLAAALVHSPPLLILDEPTVGVDPLLRQSIWKHLITLAQSEKITVVITTHYIEEARQANVVGLMRNGKLLAEDSPDNLMLQHGMDNLEDVFLKLCISDSSRKAAQLAGMSQTELAKHKQLLARQHQNDEQTNHHLHQNFNPSNDHHHHHNHSRHHHNHNHHHHSHQPVLLDANGLPIVHQSEGSERVMAKKKRQFPSIFMLASAGNNKTQQHNIDHMDAPDESAQLEQVRVGKGASHHQLTSVAVVSNVDSTTLTNDSNEMLSASSESGALSSASSSTSNNDDSFGDQNDHTKPIVGTTQEAHMKQLQLDLQKQPDFVVNKNNLRSMVPGTKYAPKKVDFGTWFKSLLAVSWKNYIRLKRNPPVLIFEFILPAVQVILFCLCIGGDPFDVPLAVVNDEVIPQASKYFLDAIDKNAIRQVPFSNLTEAIESVRRGETWGAIHIPDRYTQYLQERLLHPADITNETLTNGTINIYPDLTNLHLALAMENTFREAFIKFANDTLYMFGYPTEAAELPIKVEEPVYGTLKRNGYLEFMAPGVVISITYVMATGLTALAFILEKRDGLLERSLVSGVTTSQILLAHASVQVLVMIIQISLVLAFTFFVFDIPSNGPFFWVILLILLQGCTGMGFGLLVSAVCDEENTAVMMLVGTFYTNLILAGIIWPLEAMPRWLRWVSYMQPQTLPTETLRNILSRGWGIGETGVYLGFLVTIGWLVVFLLAAGLFMRYSK